jgi:hypothetical protein
MVKLIMKSALLIAQATQFNRINYQLGCYYVISLSVTDVEEIPRGLGLICCSSIFMNVSSTSFTDSGSYFSVHLALQVADLFNYYSGSHATTVTTESPRN